MYMCAMALSLVLVFRPVSPLSGHSLAAGRRGGPTLSPDLDPLRRTSLELKVKKYSPYHPLAITMHVGPEVGGQTSRVPVVIFIT